MALGESFETTLAAARSGTAAAWEQIYGDLAPPLLGYLRGRGAREPEDLLGEIFLQVVRDLERFEGGEREFRAWVFTIAHHRLLDESRRRRRRPAEPVPTEELEAAAGEGDAEQEALERLGHSRVVELLGELSEEQRSVLLLRVVGDLTVEQVSEVVGKRPGAVKALQRRGLAAIRKAMQHPEVTL